MPSIECHLIHSDGRTFMLAALDDRQEQFVARRMHGYWDPINIQDGTPRNDVRTIVRQYQPIDRFIRWLNNGDPDQPELL